MTVERHENKNAKYTVKIKNIRYRSNSSRIQLKMLLYMHTRTNCGAERTVFAGYYTQWNVIYTCLKNAPTAVSSSCILPAPKSIKICQAESRMYQI